MRALPELELENVTFQQVGVTVYVLPRGKPSTMYHAETDQEGFLVVRGQCLLLVEGEERPLREWDFFHCAPNTMHGFVGVSDEPCVIVMIGARKEEGTILYERNEAALKHGAGVERTTPDPSEAYAPFPHWELGRPDCWDALPWS